MISVRVATTVALKLAATKTLAEIDRRRKLYLKGRRLISVAGRAVIVSDDGIATGASNQAGE